MIFRSNGMDLQIKVISLILLTSCSTYNISDINIPNFKRGSIDESSTLIKNLEKNNTYLLLNVYDKSPKVFYQSNIYGDNVYWDSEINIGFKTFKGKITSSSGLDNDLDIILSVDSLGNLYQDNKTINALIKFSNPSTEYLPIKYSYKIKDVDGYLSGSEKAAIGINSESEQSYTLVEEIFEVPIIRWKGSNFYWISSDGTIFKSKQTFPFKNKIRYELIKK